MNKRHREPLLAVLVDSGRWIREIAGVGTPRDEGSGSGGTGAGGGSVVQWGNDEKFERDRLVRGMSGSVAEGGKQSPRVKENGPFDTPCIARSSPFASPSKEHDRTGRPAIPHSHFDFPLSSSEDL